MRFRTLSYGLVTMHTSVQLVLQATFAHLGLDCWKKCVLSSTRMRFPSLSHSLGLRRWVECGLYHQPHGLVHYSFPLSPPLFLPISPTHYTLPLLAPPLLHPGAPTHVNLFVQLKGPNLFGFQGLDFVSGCPNVDFRVWISYLDVLFTIFILFPIHPISYSSYSS